MHGSRHGERAMSKGSNPRPFDIPRDQYEANRARIWPDKPKERWVPPPLPGSDTKEVAPKQETR